MRESIEKVLTAATCILMGCTLGIVMTTSVIIGSSTTTSSADATVESEIQLGADKYTEILSLIENYFIGEDIDLTQINDAMADAIITALGDRWSYYISAEDYQAYIENINNAYVGVGITITAQYDDDGSFIGYLITEVLQNGPAEEAGVLAGDILIRVDGTDVTQITLSETKGLVKGEEGTTVDLTLFRDDGEITLTVGRRTVTTVPAEGQLLENGVGYIIIDNFDSGCYEAVKALIEELTEAGATSLLFDVRNNPGGLKSELTDLLDYLLPEGVIFHTLNYAGTEEIVTSDSDCIELPMAVLVNASSYSAAEYFACALQEYGVGIVVGEQTCGKGNYQV